jgi:hypothetical protein
MLITVDDAPIIAPAILAPIPTGKLQISGISNADLNELEQKLRNLVHK